MTKDEKEKIAFLRQEGLGYKRIASKLNVSPEAVKSYCRRNGLTGVASKAAISLCRNCGKALPVSKPGRQRKFCCDQCRRQWWKEHPQLINRAAYYTLTCAHCGKTFVTYGHESQKYCSHACYIAHRFSRE